MRGSAQKRVTNPVSNRQPLTKQQRNALDYWNGATSQLEKTSRSVLELFRRNKDTKNYTKYESQYGDFRSMRDSLSKDVNKAIQSNNLQHVEAVIAVSVKKLKGMVYLHAKPSDKSPLKRSLSDEYDEALSAITNCMTQLRKKLEIVDKCLTQLSVEMTLYTALGKELKGLMKSTLQAKEEKRENVASTVISLAPEIMSYIQTQ